jgi:pilus assembly protein CpaB
MILRNNAVKLFTYAGLFIGVATVIYGVEQMTNVRPAATRAPVVVTGSPDPVGFLIAHKAILRGHVIAKDDLEFRQSQSVRPANAEISPESAIGKIAVADIAEGSVILSQQISADPAAAGLAPLIPVGYRAVELLTNDEIAVGNFIRPGDHVDVELVLRENVLPKQSDAQEKADGDPSEAHTVIQDVTILAVGDALTAQPVSPPPQGNNAARRPEPPHAVTLAMTPDQIAQFMLARSLGALHLSLRNPIDFAAVAGNIATLTDIRSPMSSPQQGRRPIELITGNKMRHIFSANPGEKP